MQRDPYFGAAKIVGKGYFTDCRWWQAEKEKKNEWKNDLYGEHTDYTHLTFDGLSEYLEGKAQTIEYFMEFITNDKKEVVESGYWDSKVDFNFKSIADECIELYTSTIVELRDIKSEIKNEV